MKKIFIAGTDTGVGKTFTSVKFLHFLNQKCKKTLGLKPIASGAYIKDGKYFNHDALALLNASSVKNASYAQINPFVFKQPIAPHLAAKIENRQLTVENVVNKIETTCNAIKADKYIIEGVGGWSVPLNTNETTGDLVKALNVPVILVVGMKLGCLNHAILTAQAIIRSGVPLIGWVANCITPNMQAMQGNIKTLMQWIKAPLLSTIPFNSKKTDHFTTKISNS